MIPVVEQGSIGGVRVLRSASATGRNAAALVFGVGRYDETLPTAGITHLIEHLTLSGRPKASYEFNAEVSGRFTQFVMESADPADTADFIATVCQGLATDYGAALEREKRILKTEAVSRGPAGALGMCLGERYGATGPGLTGYEEYGLDRLGWTEIEAWRRRWFVAGNAVLWIHGTIPRGLRIELPPYPAPAMTPLYPVNLALPGFVVAGRGGIGLSLAGPQSDPVAVALAILQERLTQVLRHERGLSYGVHGTRDQLDRDTWHAWLVADALPEQTAMVGHSMLATLESLAEGGSTAEETGEYVRRLRSVYESPSGPAMVMSRQLQDILSGRRPRDPAETLLAVSTVDKQAVAWAAGQLLGQMIVATPQLVPAIQGRMPRLPLWSTAAITGTTLRSIDSGSSLTVGDQGVMRTVEAGQHVTIRSGAVAALLRWKDKKRALIGTDGFTLVLDPAEWPDGDTVVRSIEARIDPRLVVSIDSPGPGRPKPEPPPAAATPPPAAAPLPPHTAPPGEVTVRRSWGSRILLAVNICVVIFGVLAVAGGDVAGGIAFLLIGAMGLTWQQLTLRRTTRRLGHSGDQG